MGNFVEDALVNPANLGRLGVPGLPFVLLGLAELAGGACLVEDPIFAMIRKRQVASNPANDMGSERIMIASLFAIAA